jgi:hypothetical protein
MVPPDRRVLLPLAVLGGLQAVLSIERLLRGQGAWWTALAELGLVALVMVPALVTLLLLAKRPRPRAGSLLARAGERMRWFVVGGFACGGALLALPDWYGLRSLYPSGPPVAWIVAGVGLGMLGLCLRSSARDLGRARRACSDEGSLELVGAGQVSSSTEVLDIGVGNRWLGDLTDGGTAYRARQQVAHALVGDPSLGVGRLRRAHRRLRWGCLGALASVGIALACVSWRPALQPRAEQAQPAPLSERIGGTGLQTLTP